MVMTDEGECVPEKASYWSNTNVGMAEKYLLSVLSAFVAELVTYPLDLTKTRLQIQGEGGGVGSVYRGMVSTALGVAREEGLRALWLGVTPGLGRHVIYSGVRMSLYDIGRNKVRQSGTEMNLFHRAILGMSSGAFAQFVASPADLIKVRMQMEGRRRLQGLPSRGEGMKDFLKQTLREGGIKSLWKGALPNTQRAALVNVGDLTTYDQAKSYLIENGWSPHSWTTHCLSSVCAGLAAATLGTPADVIKARMMNQPVDANGRGLYYRGSIDCLLKAVKSEGFFSLYKGFVPCWLRMAPWSMTFWLTFEKLRAVMTIEAW